LIAHHTGNSLKLPGGVSTDIYSNYSHIGRGGWTWYTGAAGWLYRLGLEGILGLKCGGKVLKIHPCIPKNWSDYKISYQNGETRYQIIVENPNGINCGLTKVEMDGGILPEGDIPLLADGNQHNVRVTMG
jgi:cellobiose phosphorylase